MEQDFLDFADVVPKEIKVSNVPGASGKRFVLREASQRAILKYQEANLGLWDRVVDNEKGTTTVRQVKAGRSTDALLVSLCLFDETDEGNSKPVPLETVQGWPPAVQRRLFEKAEEMSDLDRLMDLPSLREEREKLSRRIEKLERQEKNGQSEPA